MKKIGILFDLDGTLMDTIQDLTDSVNFALSQFDLPLRENWQTRKVLGNGAKSLITQSMPGREDDPPVEEVLAVFKAHYAEHSQDKTRPYEGITEVVEKLAQDYPVAIVSNKPDAAVKVLCADYFPGIFALGESPDLPRKPNGDMVHYAMKQLGVDTCIYVGDSEVDIRTAENTGVPCLTVLWGLRSREELEAAGAKYFCEKAEDMAAVIEKILTKASP